MQELIVAHLREAAAGSLGEAGRSKGQEAIRDAYAAVLADTALDDLMVPGIDPTTGEVNTRPGKPTDYFPMPYPNDVAAANSNGGKVPPDLSLMVKAREGGAAYIYSILTGYREQPAELLREFPDAKSPNGTYYNPYFSALNIGMTASLVTASASAQGPVVQMGDEAGGAGLLLEGGRPVFVYNPTGRSQQFQRLEGSPLSAGAHEVTVSVTADPGAGPRAARIALLVDGRADASIAVPVFYGARGEGTVGRYGTRTLAPGLANPPARDLAIDRVTFRRR